MALFDDIKLSMRITHNVLDTDIQNDMKAATLDLVRVGVQPFQKDADGEFIIDESENKKLKDDALINKAIELYCKWQADYQGKGDRWELSYKSLRDSLSLCGDYIE